MKILLIGSGHSAIQVKDLDLSQYHKVIAINNAWQATEAWDVWLHSTDFHGTKCTDFKDNQIEIDKYNQYTSKYGGTDKCGFSITLIAGYYALSEFDPDEIHFLGCDMNYEPNSNGDTHFYGVGFDINMRGTPDPLRMGNIYGLENETPEECVLRFYNRFEEISETQHKCKLFNISRDTEIGLLPYRKKKI